MLKPREKVPNLEVDLINDTHWKLEDQTPKNFILVVFYRGLHCPICKKQLEELAGKLDKFVDRGVNVVAISCDTEEKAKKTGNTWNVPSLPIGFEMSIDKAREWGLYISKAKDDKEPNHFSEPGMFLIRPDQTLYFASIQTMPFARPGFDDILNAIDYVMKNDYPARGES
ncbi:AhpC/TSA family protein [Aquimarina sp. U1-2]|uniref:peroxiredoxin-like family protein n=1 Tax=Aquimarina sp. U1-2 TaxID=2823141 RepID=UPI001AECBC18|nr:peroxiredoxin-like family protein [Aquimarina sp. U1-2]MBP2832975.1 AhpC/TSA family protein [Aquimarina sp. U1-2]